MGGMPGCAILSWLFSRVATRTAGQEAEDVDLTEKEVEAARWVYIMSDDPVPAAMTSVAGSAKPRVAWAVIPKPQCREVFPALAHRLLGAPYWSGRSLHYAEPTRLGAIAPTLAVRWMEHFRLFVFVLFIPIFPGVCG